METCFVNPEITNEDKSDLRVIIDEACCGYKDFHGRKIEDVIANSGILLKDKESDRI